MKINSHLAVLTTRIAIALVLGAVLLPGFQAGADPDTTVVLVRHAEKDTTIPEDPPLTEAGQARAETLAHVAAELGVTTIFTSRYARTRQTVRPLAEQLGLTPVEYDAGDGGALVASILADHRGETVLVAGHSNTVPSLIGLLGGPELPDIDGRVYHDLYVVTVPGGEGEVRLLHLRYGTPTPLPDTVSPPPHETKRE
jgi:broad specificity phosphatase PhoE